MNSFLFIWETTRISISLRRTNLGRTGSFPHAIEEIKSMRIAIRHISIVSLSVVRGDGTDSSGGPSVWPSFPSTIDIPCKCFFAVVWSPNIILKCAKRKLLIAKPLSISTSTAASLFQRSWSAIWRCLRASASLFSSFPAINAATANTLCRSTGLWFLLGNNVAVVQGKRFMYGKYCDSSVRKKLKYDAPDCFSSEVWYSHVVAKVEEDDKNDDKLV